MQTSKQLTLLSTEDQSTLSQVVFLASPTALPESAKEKTTIVISGRKCLELFDRSSRHGSWAKTFAALLVGTGEWYSTRCKLTWKLLATKSSRLYFQLAPSTLRIEETEFGLLPTPKATEIEEHYTAWKARMIASGNPKNIGKTTCNLGTMARSGLLPTPTAFDYNSARTPQKWEQDKAKYAAQGVNLQNPLKQMAVLGLLPTPTASSDPKGGCHRTDPKRQNDTLAHAMHSATNQQAGKTSQLNPRFVAEMMGFPPNWTELPFLNGETTQSKPTETL